MNKPLDRSIVERFGEEIAMWPKQQARAARRIIKAVLSGDAALDAVLDRESGDLGELTYAQWVKTSDFLRAVCAERTH